MCGKTIENDVHWVRDVTLDEDRSQVRTGAIPCHPGDRACRSHRPLAPRRRDQHCRRLLPPAAAAAPPIPRARALISLSDVTLIDKWVSGDFDEASLAVG